MKKFILGAVAAGALAVGGAASAQDLGAVLNNILGYGYGDRTSQDTIQGSYRDEYGRLWVVDGGGKHTMVTPGAGSAGVGSWGQGTYGVQANGGYYRDSDGDGVVDARDRRPNNPRRW
ncbi:hypothetical protein H8N03_01930 [Ramlibacter sp. USB13]|uniref:Calcium-binding protein n=1 Tax=Ramlibacter cellulosilyticus TaxID=2764187 RepID=A0A923MP68_9BURK|nr:hypothetical protein [Ramlibacter cellulosilyticus]MBC5781684.1 hypothetical protein [Ramlibacter cellulosilyticus]